MSQVITLQLQDEQMERLQRVAHQMGRTPSEVSAVLVEEGLRRTDFPYIDFRDSVVGRQAYVMGSRLAVWQVIDIARSYDMSAQATADHLEWPLYKIEAAFQYFAAFPDEIEVAVQENNAVDFAAIKRMLPHANEFVFTEE